MYYWVCESYQIHEPVGIYQVRFCSTCKKAAKRFMRANRDNYFHMLYLLERDYEIEARI